MADRTVLSTLRALAFAVLSLASSLAYGQAARQFGFAYDQPTTTAYGIAANIFDAKLKELSGGKMSINPRLGWLELVLNTPSAHRVHHAANLEYLDANYGGVLIVFDRLFGTYRAERDDVPCRNGLVVPMVSYNLLHIELHQWRALARDLLAARSLRAVFGHLAMPPGWRADGRGTTTEDLRAEAARATADAVVSPAAADAGTHGSTTPAGVAAA